LNALSLSIIIPAYNEDSRIAPTLEKILAFFRSREESFEVLIVDDGSHDRTAEVIEGFADSEVKLFRLGRNAGKGAAVRKGVLGSRGNLVLVMDADLAIPIDQYSQFRDLIESGFDVACGSRGLPESRPLNRLPFVRRRMGLTFNWIARAMALTEFHDTQCGFKLYRGALARDVFSRCRIDRFAYDVESLCHVRRLGGRVVEVPIHWRHVPESRVHPFFDSVQMFVDLIRIRITTWRAGGSK
jgi:dolichyl-phosphate beta-glucosyltransferase